ncbi:MAG: amidohydrolase [Anaerolineales bacterium]|nr:amidohydrolase [Anaerolineales bacterium]MCB8991660.1 amidohydrolase [Ardenticatenaceae bacterium]
MTADLIITNAKIYTVDETQPWAEAAAVQHGRFHTIGSNAQIKALAGPHTRHIDAGGRLLLPGLIDAHVHFLQYAIRQQQISLFGVADFAEVLSMVETAVSQAKPGQWILGWGWDELHWHTAPTAAHLDAISPHNPIALARMDMHTWWVNSAALQIAGITAATPDPPESKIERDAAGHPNGILREWQAIELVEQHIPQPDEATLIRWLREAIPDAHRYGLTGIHDQRIEREGRESFRLWQNLWRQGQLKLRVHMNIAADFIAEADTLGLQPGFGDEWLWIGHVKAFADGTMGSRTAHMLAPFEGEPGNTGVVVTSADELFQTAVAAAETGFSISVHAIGDRAVRELLDVLSERQPADEQRPLPLPHRIEHVQLIHPDDLPRLAQLGVFASMQPVHLQTDWPTADRVWGARARYAYAFCSLLQQGTPLAFGSDAPVAPLNPMLGIYTAVTRQDPAHQPADGWYPQERLTLEETIYAYTMGPAALSGKAHLQGSITPGKWADCILLADNLFEIPAAAIQQTQVAMTMVGGEVVYE